MAVNDIYYKRLTDSGPEMAELDEDIREALELHRENVDTDADYDANTDGRAALESMYERRLVLQYLAAKTFHPFSEFGKMCLEKAQEITDEYESEVGYLHTRITKANVKRFKGSLSEDMIDDIRNQRLNAIGALRYDGDGVYGVGALVYMVDTDLLEENYLLRIKWLYVKEEYRGEGIATIMLGNLLWKSNILRNENVVVEVPLGFDWNRAYYNMLSDWHFDFEAGFAPQIYIRTSEVELISDVKKMSKQADSIKLLPTEERQRLFEDFGRRDDRFYKMISLNLPEDYFDEELSCFCSDGEKIVGVLLMHRLPSGIIRMEYLGGDQRCMGYLLSYMVKRAKAVCKKDTLLELDAESYETGEILDLCFPDQIRRSMLMAVLQKPYGIEDADPEVAMELLSYFLRQQ